MSDPKAPAPAETAPNLSPEQILNEWLVFAKDGRLKAVALAGVISTDGNDTTLSTFSQSPPVTLIAAVEVMAFRLKYFALLAQRAFG